MPPGADEFAEHPPDDSDEDFGAPDRVIPPGPDYGLLDSTQKNNFRHKFSPHK